MQTEQERTEGDGEMFIERTEITQVTPAEYDDTWRSEQTVPDTASRIRPLTQLAIITPGQLAHPEFIEWDKKLPQHSSTARGASRVAIYLTATKSLRYMLWKLRGLAPEASAAGLIRKLIEAEYLRNFSDEQPQ